MKKVIAGVACLVLCLSIAARPALAQGGSVRVSAERTSVRDRAATDGAVVATVTRGEQLPVVEVAGSWFKVRTPAGREGYVYSLFVERVAGAGASPSPGATPSVASAAPAAPATPPSPPPAATQVSAGQPSAPRFGGNGSEPLGNRRFGAGLANIGPSVRYWMDAKKGFQVDGYFRSNFGYSVAAISPSFLARFKEPKVNGSMTFAPYWGAGITYYRFGSGYHDYYCGRYANCSSSSIGFGGFVGSEVAFENLPKLAISGQAGFYSGVYGYGGLGIGLGVHWYPGAN